MAVLRNLTTLLTFLFISCMCRAQSSYSVNMEKSCKAMPGDIPDPPTNTPPKDSDCPGCKTIYAYPPDDSVQAIFIQLINSSRTLSNSNLSQRIYLREAKVNNFISTYTNDSNIIFYDRDFYNQFKGIKDVDITYLIKFSLAHELGHFVNLDVGQKRDPVESERNADLFACGLLIELSDVSVDKIRNSIFSLAPAGHDLNYPSKGERIKFVDSFFNSKKGLYHSTQRRKKAYFDFSYGFSLPTPPYSKKPKASTGIQYGNCANTGQIYSLNYTVSFPKSIVGIAGNISYNVNSINNELFNSINTTGIKPEDHSLYREAFAMIGPHCNLEVFTHFHYGISCLFGIAYINFPDMSKYTLAYSFNKFGFLYGLQTNYCYDFSKRLFFVSHLSYCKSSSVSAAKTGTSNNTNTYVVNYSAFQVSFGLGIYF